MVLKVRLLMLVFLHQNTVDNPNKVIPVEFKKAKINKKGELVVEMPKMSIVTLQIK